MAAVHRSYQLPWDGAATEDRRFRQLAKHLLIATVVFGFAIPFLPLPEKAADEPEELPPRFARLLLERPAPPPPPPVVEVESKPKPEQVVEKSEPVVAAEPEPVVRPKPVEKAREKAKRAGLLPFADQLASLRDSPALDNVMGDQSLDRAAGAAKQVERSVIAAKAGRGSGGISTSGMSRNTGGGELEGRATTRVESPVGGYAQDGPKVVKGGSAPSRSREEIELVFEKNKGAIFALYNRALRRDPGLQGKLVLKITIEPSGAVSDCAIESSELNDPELERKLVQRVKLFRFEDKDVATVTTTKPIDFFPA